MISVEFLPCHTSLIRINTYTFSPDQVHWMQESELTLLNLTLASDTAFPCQALAETAIRRVYEPK